MRQQQGWANRAEARRITYAWKTCIRWLVVTVCGATEVAPGRWEMAGEEATDVEEEEAERAVGAGEVKDVRRGEEGRIGRCGRCW